ncbi:hypothetical protein F4777DRAFT_65589 [Nemania sp. FL0916]|nr:hypothetical protein F4777DRAFT_65589 [Nemania sp. FL0916]
MMEKSRCGPCMFTTFEVPNVAKFVDGFHNHGCVHGDPINTEVKSGIQASTAVAFRTESSGNGNTPWCDNGTTISLSPVECIEYFCGVGGVKPVPAGHAELRFGSLAFEDDNSTAISTLHDDTRTKDLLLDLERASGMLQQLQGCCDSFSFLWLHESYAELVRIDLETIRRFDDIPLERISPKLTKKTPQSCALVAQFFSLAFLSYSQAHCGKIRPFFLDTPLSRVILAGNQQWTTDFNGPCIVGSMIELSCLGAMLKQQVFAFQYFDQYDRNITLERSKLDVLASPEDILDIWGPGEFLAPTDDKENLYAISIGGGLITPISMVPLMLHWSAAGSLGPQPTMTFGRTRKAVIGAKVSSNGNCQAKPQEQLQLAFSMLNELGTFPNYWEVSERQLGFGLQTGQGAIALLQFNQTWVKRRGVTKKSRLLAQKTVYLADLEGYFGIQVSVCTGIARRVRLRDLLSDILPAYVDALIAKPPGWKSLLEDFNILQALKEGDLSVWLDSLEYSLQSTFESLVVAILFLLQDTGVDRTGENFIIGCIQPKIPFQCFNIPCRRENYWTRMAADSEDIATFAYVTTQCLETDVVKCQGSQSYWANSTAILWTAVSCCDEERHLRASDALRSPTVWKLKHSEAYLIGKPEAPLLVRVDRRDDHDEPRLLVSVSTIRSDFLLRLHRRTGSRPKRLKERGAFNQKAENVMVLASTNGQLR